ncbi:hypothetical protein JCM3766R1_006834 [Sporobolomyces carnicolor]
MAPSSLRRRKSLASGLSALALTPIHPKEDCPPPRPRTPPVEMPQAPYSFLAIVLEGFAEEPVPHWREKCELIGTDGRAAPSIHRRKTFTNERIDSHTGSLQSGTSEPLLCPRITGTGEADMLDAAKEFSIFGSSGGPELANQASRVNTSTGIIEMAVTASLGVVPTRSSLASIESGGRSSSSRSTTTPPRPFPDATSPLTLAVCDTNSRSRRSSSFSDAAPSLSSSLASFSTCGGASSSSSSLPPTPVSPTFPLPPVAAKRDRVNF